MSLLISSVDPSKRLVKCTSDPFLKTNCDCAPAPGAIGGACDWFNFDPDPTVLIQLDAHLHNFQLGLDTFAGCSWSLVTDSPAWISMFPAGFLSSHKSTITIESQPIGGTLRIGHIQAVAGINSAIWGPQPVVLKTWTIRQLAPTLKIDGYDPAMWGWQAPAFDYYDLQNAPWPGTAGSTTMWDGTFPFITGGNYGAPQDMRFIGPPSGIGGGTAAGWVSGFGNTPAVNYSGLDKCWTLQIEVSSGTGGPPSPPPPPSGGLWWWYGSTPNGSDPVGDNPVGIYTKINPMPPGMVTGRKDNVPTPSGPEGPIQATTGTITIVWDN